MKKRKPTEVFSLAVFRWKSDVVDLDFAKTDVCIQQNDTLGLGFGIILMLDGSEGAAGICFHMVAFGNENGQFTEGAIGFNGAIFGNFFTAAEVDGQLTEA